jgi:hypothetical protein
VTIAKRPSWWAEDVRTSASDLPVVTSDAGATHWHDGQIDSCAEINLSSLIVVHCCADVNSPPSSRRHYHSPSRAGLMLRLAVVPEGSL